MLPVIYFKKQPVMRKVVYCLIPPLIAGIYFFGWVSLAIVALSLSCSIITEWLFVRKKTGKVSEAVLVTGMLFGLILPPTIPFYMVILGSVFAVSFGKMAFGGFGFNVFNPAMVGRAFVYITFPIHMTNRWIAAAGFSDFPGGFVVWRFLPKLPASVEAITTATYSHAYRAVQSGPSVQQIPDLPSLRQLFFGDIHGTFEYLGRTMSVGAGSLGEVSAVLLMAGGIYLILKKVAKWRLVLSFLGVYMIAQTVLHAWQPDLAPPLLHGIFSGGAILGGFFMVTDPVSAPKTRGAQYMYGGFIAVFTNIIRTFSLFAGGLMFSILLGNMFASLFDHGVKAWQKRGAGDS
jgi:Na+-transporting NADH:ubiquinone oxidoreductase subunit B